MFVQIASNFHKCCITVIALSAQDSISHDGEFLVKRVCLWCLPVSWFQGPLFHQLDFVCIQSNCIIMPFIVHWHVVLDNVVSYSVTLSCAQAYT